MRHIILHSMWMSLKWKQSAAFALVTQQYIILKHTRFPFFSRSKISHSLFNPSLVNLKEKKTVNNCWSQEKLSQSSDQEKSNVDIEASKRHRIKLHSFFPHRITKIHHILTVPYPRAKITQFNTFPR